MKLENIDVGGRKFKLMTGDINCPTYMLKMIMRNMPKHLVPFSMSEKGSKIQLMYETDTRKPIRDFLMENGANKQWIKNFLLSLDGIIALCGEYLINQDYIVLSVESIFYSVDTGEILYIFNPFESNDFNLYCRKLLVDIAGNYFLDHAVSGEIFRERFLREVGNKNFNLRNILADWEILSYREKNDIVKSDLVTPKKAVKATEIIKELFSKINKKEDLNATMAITNTSGFMCLTGICSINTKIPIKEEGVTVGRTMLQKEYGLYNSGIGKNHARVYKQDGNIFATDLGSKNGTYLNGEQLDKRVPVKIERGDILAFSDEEFILC